jgi:hypothetical protein
MSDQWPGVGSEQPYAQSEATDPWSANGAGPATELGDDQAGDGSSNVVELADEAVAAAIEGEATEYADADADVDDGSVFMAMLVRAMQTTASVERIRVAENTERRRQAVIDKVRARQATEANRMRELASEDMRAIDAWAEQETKRIQHERERRAMEVNEDLQTSLAGHHRRIDREIEGIEAAVTTYLADVETFFAALDRETDLVAIAQQAGRRPVFPSLDTASETIAAGDSAESQIEGVTPGTDDQAIEAPLVGVMDEQASADPLQAWGAEPGTSQEGAPAQSDEATTEEAQVSEPVATGGSWSWRGGGGDGGDGSNRDS